MDKKHDDNNLRAIGGEISVNEDNRTIELSFSSEEPYRRWFGLEILDHNSESVDLSRLNTIGTLLFNHDVDKVIGKIEKAWVENNRGKAIVKFDDDEESEKIYQKVKSGTLKATSVRYSVDVWEDVENGAVSSDGRFQGPCSIAKRWIPSEISIVSVPADPTVGVGRSFSEDNGGINMPENKNVKDNNVQDNSQRNDNEELQRKLEEERARVKEIRQMARSFNLDQKFFDNLIDNGTSIEEARKSILEELARNTTPVNTTASVQVGTEEIDKFKRAATDGLSMRVGLRVDKPVDGAREFAGKSLLRLAEESVFRQTGQDMRNARDVDIFERALEGTGAFPIILSNVANKTLRSAYEEAPTTFQFWTAVGSNKDFKPTTQVQLSSADVLEKMTEAGEFKNKSFKETKVNTQLDTYGASFAITRKALINDDLGAFTEVMALFGESSKRMINQMCYKLLTEKDTKFENVALFDKSKHNNLGTGKISIKSLAAAKSAMSKQTDISGKAYLNIQPGFLIVPTELEVEATQLVGSSVDPTKYNNTPNPFFNRLTVISDPYITNTQEWYLAAARGRYQSIKVSYLNGVQTPIIERADDFDSLGVKYRVYLDVGVDLVDYRGLYKSDGNAAE
ncbi:prohead protease/major capsid protein fusion protein [Megamonas sp.]|uniref:prohead protease/major capsid protein fusion protein n=1 Tax=Megamonas sp. TaxID=2049033 RepID=UPI00258285DA|nr:prohead protease/major capsid protein fusion protein [Megamonas sp.]